MIPLGSVAFLLFGVVLLAGILIHRADGGSFAFDTIELKVFNAGGVDKGRYDTAAEVRDLIASDPQSTLKTTKKKTIIDSDDWKLVITHAKGTNADDVLGAMDIMIL